ncbi:hypothetical protein M885DRAFT_473458 [Pelagophyceae sp. CCMP2097]|nr:hypothetical protein M885DRAFT_473458 [Pelagophyceae sp. CCMP2097]
MASAKKAKLVPVELFCLEDNTTQINSSVGIDTPLFTPSPDEVHFRDYAPFGCVERTLRFRNNDHVARRIKVLQPKSPYFDVSGPRGRGAEPLKQSKVAPGMEVCFTVTFRPQEVREYKVDLVCCTEREKFIVPVRAFGLQAELSLPAEVDFGVAAVKSSKPRSLLVQNVGACAASYRLSCTPAHIFDARPAEGAAGVGQMATLELAFTPQRAQAYEGTLFVEFLSADSPRVVAVALRGVAEDVDVHLSTVALQLEPAYVSLSSQRTFKVRNASEIPVRFAWKQFADLGDQEAERRRLHADLDRMHELEEAHLEETLALAAHSAPPRAGGDESDGDLSGDEGAVPVATRSARAALTTKYRHLRQALEKDDMVFADENFELKPLSGEVCALSEIEVSVTFRPETAADYACAAYLDVVGREERLPIQLGGVGIGPKGALSYDVLDMGDVFIGSEYAYDVAIANKGDIPATWRLSQLPPPQSPHPQLRGRALASAFEFAPRGGCLAVGGADDISVKFCGRTLGEFCELLEVQLEGSNETLTCQFKGHVIGPTFHFDCDLVDFGLCSFSFAHERTMTLTNTADIGMDFALGIPQDGRGAAAEFALEPRGGHLAAGEAVTIHLSFTPQAVKVFDFYLVVDVAGVGEALLSIPISAECQVPDVTLAEADVDFGPCFVRYPYERELVLVNSSDALAARYEVAAQEPQTAALGEYTCAARKGVIPPATTLRVAVTLRCHKLGALRLPLTTTVAGSAQPPLSATLAAKALGPAITVAPAEMDWGPTDCLVDAPRTLTVTNTSCIPAPFKTFVKSARSKFRVDLREYSLAPYDSVELKCVARLDDTTHHKDQLHIVVSEGDNMMVPLTAKGVGTTMWCHEDLSAIDFGSQFTATYFERKITLENKGRRLQTIKWVNETWVQAQAEGARAAKKKALGPGGDKGRKDSVDGGFPAAGPTFVVIPEEVELRPRTAAIFTFRGFSTAKGGVDERMVCEARVHKEKVSKPVFSANVRADVIEPLLKFSESTLAFVYDHVDPAAAVPAETRELTLTNASALPLSFALRCATPFQVDQWEHSLEPGAAVVVRVEFDPGFRGDRVSQRIDTRLTVAYHAHPQRDSVALTGEINFPNLHFEQQLVNFGCILNDTSATLRMRVTNCSTVETSFAWAFLEDDDAKQAATARKPYVAVNQVFDILPLRSTLAAGETEDVEFVYFGHAGRKFKGTCLCEVAGGPEYQIGLAGEASTVGYKLDKDRLDFGPVLYTKSDELEFSIANSGKVAFPFSVSLHDSARVFEVHPTSGKVAANDKVTITVRLAPNLPVAFGAHLVVDVAHFEPVEVALTGEGIFASVQVSLPCDVPRMTLQTSDALGGTWAHALEKTRGDLAAAIALPPPPPAAPGAAKPDDAAAAPPPHGPASSRRKPTLGEVEAEASRRIFLDHLRVAGARTRRAEADRALEVRLEAEGDAGVAPKKKAPRKRAPADDSAAAPPFVLSWHACDFGNVVAGTTRKRSFKVTNTSRTGPLSWFFEKKLLQGSGFSIEPEKVVRLAEGASATFDVTFAANKDLQLGNREALLPIDPKSGPLITVVLRALITMPEIALSVESLDFGPVWVGCARTLHLQLHNTSPVVAEWDLKKAMGSSRDEARFTFSSRSGVLQPGRKQNVAVEFVPLDARLCTLKLPLKVTQSTKTWNVSFAGAGVVAKLVFEPALVQIGPVLPFSDDATGATTASVVMRNVSDRPVEVFSLDFDADYVAEEAFLQTYHGFDDAGLLRIPVRHVGTKLPFDIDPVAIEELADGEQAPTDGAVAAAPAEDAAEAEDPDGCEADGDAFGGPCGAKPVSLRARGLARDVALVAPPLCGGRNLAAHLAKKHAYAVCTPLGALEAVSRVRSALGSRARRALGCPTAAEAAEDAGFDAPLADEKEAKKGSPRVDEAKKAAEAANEAHAAEVAARPAADDVNLLREALAWRASRADAGRGLVVDLSDAAPSAAPLARAARAVRLALPACTLLTISPTDAAYAKRLAACKADARALYDADFRAAQADAADDSASQPADDAAPASRAAEAQVLTDAGRAVWRVDRLRFDGDDAGLEAAARALEEVIESLVDADGALKRDKPPAVDAAPAPAVEPAPEAAPAKAEAVPVKAAKADAAKAKSAPAKAEVPAKAEDAPAAVDVPPAKVSPLTAYEAQVEAAVAEFAPVPAPAAEAGADEAAAPAAAPVEVSPALEVSADMVVDVVLSEHFEKLQGKAPLEVPPYFTDVLEQAPEPAEPPPDPNALQIPPPATNQLLRRPPARPARAMHENFSIVTDEGAEPAAAPAQADPEATPVAAAAEVATASLRAPENKAAKGGSKEVEAAAEAAAAEAAAAEAAAAEAAAATSAVSVAKAPTRWVIPAHSEVRFGVRFYSTRVGRSSAALGFEVVGVAHEFSLPCAGACATPSINADQRNVFMARVKQHPPLKAQPVAKRFVVSANAYDFGPLLTWKQPAMCAEPPRRPEGAASESPEVEPPPKVDLDEAQQAALERASRERGLVSATNCDTFRISNNGPFATTVDFEFAEAGAAAAPEKVVAKDAKKDGKKADDAAAVAALAGGVFLAEPASMYLAPGETRDLTVWAFPPTTGAFSDRLLACVAQNPEPYAFAVQCAGVEPALALAGPWEDDETAAQQRAAQAAADEAARPTTARDKKGAALKDEKAEEPTGPVLDFDRLLLGRSETREFTLTNAAACAVAWRLDVAELDALRASRTGADGAPLPPLASELRIEPTSGRLPIHGSARVRVFFAAVDECVVSPKIKILYSDVEGGLEDEARTKSLDLVLRAEAYEIRAVMLDDDDDADDAKAKDAKAKDPKAKEAKGKKEDKAAAVVVPDAPDEAAPKAQPGSLNFGEVRVGETRQLGFVLRNKGKYDFSFAFGLKKSTNADVFSVSPAAGRIAAGASARVLVTCEAARQLRLSDNKDVVCTISEPATGEAVESFAVTVSATATFPRFRVQPGRGLLFGTVKFNDAPKERRLELRNEGKFSFAFAIADADADFPLDACKRLLAATPAALLRDHATADDVKLAQELGLLPPPEPEAVEGAVEAPADRETRLDARRDFFAKAADVADAEAPSAADRAVGPFVISPGGGVVEPGQSLSVVVKFDPKGVVASHKARVDIRIAGCDSADDAVPAAQSYELFAESRSPGVNTSDWYEIFEEQAVIAGLADAVDAVDAPADADAGVVADVRTSALPAAGSIFAIREKIFSFGTTLLSEDQRGSAERFKISNPNKVAAAVNFAVSAKAGAPEFAGGEAAFKVQPEKWEVPPHEHRYVTVYFQAREMKEYRAVFTATVEDSADAATGMLAFDLGGRGTLPSVAVDDVPRSAAGLLAFDFGRLQVGRTRVKTLTLRNDGIVSATALIELKVAAGGDGSPTKQAPMTCFRCAHAGSSVTLEPGASLTISVEFVGQRPHGSAGDEEAACAAVLAISVVDNQYEATAICVSGILFENDVSIEDLPGGADDVLDFGELNLACEASALGAKFSLRNARPGPVRYEWQEHPALSFSPRFGHLAAGAVLRVEATFRAGGVPTALDLEKVSLETVQIEYADGPAEAWDCDLRLVRAATPEDLAVLLPDEAAPAPGGDKAKPGKAAAAAAPAKGKKGEAAEAPPAVDTVTLGEVRDGVPMVVVAPREPAHTAASKPRAQQLACRAVADTPAYACETSVVAFRATPLFQTTSHSFDVTNTSKVKLDFGWVLKNAGAAAAAAGKRPPTSAAGAPPVGPPFSVEPARGEVLAGATQRFLVRFAPLEVEDYQYAAECVMPALTVAPAPEDPDGAEPAAPGALQAPLRVWIRGKATRPACHFDLEANSDYLSRRVSALLNEHGRRDQIEASSVRVVEVSSRGLRVANTKRFHVANPTAASYDFSWEPVGQPHAAWRCGTPRGAVLSGKRGEMVFEFTPATTGVAEAFYRFRVPEHAINELFLFVGTVVEPRVALDRARVDFSAVMLGSVATETVHLVNHEHLPFAFSFERPAVDDGAARASSSGGDSVLEVSPMSGLVPPHGRCAVELVYRPRAEAPMNANLACTVRKKLLKLHLNVKGEGYAVHARLLLLEGAAARAGLAPRPASRQQPADADEARQASAVGALPPSGAPGVSELRRAAPDSAANVVDFGTVHLNQTLTKSIAVANNGKFNFDYLVDRGVSANPMLMVSGASSAGTVRKGEFVVFDVTFHPVSPTQLDGSAVTVVLAGKFEYVLQVRGRGVAPQLRFSWLEHDFGACFTTVPGAPPLRETAVLRVTNYDATSPLSLDCALPKNASLAVDCAPAVLAPGDVVDVAVHFTPREAQAYTFPVPFVVNGATTVTVLVRGRGVAARLDLVNAAQAACDFGAVREGAEAVRRVQVVNRSLRPLSFDFVDVEGKLAAAGVTLASAGVRDLKPRGVVTLEVRFAPTRRARDFAEAVAVRFAGSDRHLLSVSGRATGMELALSTDTLSFGAVCVGSRRTRRLALENSGDVATRFRWDAASLGDMVTVSPLEGVLPPSTEVAFDVTFAPREVDADVRVEGLRLYVDGSPPLSLACVGACVPQPDESKQTLDFASVARKAQTLSVKIANGTQKAWFVAPTLRHLDAAAEHWSCAAELRVPPGGEATLDVVYLPLSMTAGEERHAAELFVALPDGSALLYNLRGAAGPPETIVLPARETPAKASLQIAIPVSNWLAEPQHFTVRLEVEGEAGTQSTFLEGTSTFDLAAVETKDYALRFFAYREGAETAVVTLTNAVTGEYARYEAAVQVGAAGVGGTLAIEAPVRQPARRLITVDNPLPKDADVTFAADWWSCDSPHVRLSRLGNMAGSQEGVFEVEYRPLVSGPAVDAKLRFKIAELGSYEYALRLTATPPPSTPQLRFEAPLGASQTETFEFRAFPSAAKQATYACSVQKARFFDVAATVAAPAFGEDAWEGALVRVVVKFEPEALGAIHDTLTVDAGDAGVYSCALTGVCRRPEPRGPFAIRAGEKQSIDIRNVFGEARAFSFHVDHADFEINGATATINSRAAHAAVVTFNPKAPNAAPVVAKLLVSCDHGGEAISWVYYLRGLPKA